MPEKIQCKEKRRCLNQEKTFVSKLNHNKDEKVGIMLRDKYEIEEKARREYWDGGNEKIAKMEVPHFSKYSHFTYLGDTI